jgi:hypothetical protein
MAGADSMTIEEVVKQVRMSLGRGVMTAGFSHPPDPTAVRALGRCRVRPGWATYVRYVLTLPARQQHMIVSEPFGLWRPCYSPQNVTGLLAGRAPVLGWRRRGAFLPSSGRERSPAAMRDVDRRGPVHRVPQTGRVRVTVRGARRPSASASSGARRR